MERDTWQLRLLWLSSNYTEPTRIWYEIINHLEINKAFTRAAIIDKVNQIRRGKPMYPSNNAIGHMGGGPSKFREKCMQCGECLLGQFAGICPMTQCAKGLLNGPCGGASNGKCEADPKRDCAWELIYDRLKKLGALETIKQFVPPKDYSKMARPRKIEVAPLIL
jgi:hypothetical protein